MSTPQPLTDLRRRAPEARKLIAELLTERIGTLHIEYMFYREWNGCWKVRTTLSGSTHGVIEFTLLDTPSGGMLAWPSPYPAQWSPTTGIRANDHTVWILDDHNQWVCQSRSDTNS
jgi:hypothetical protein